MPDDIAIELDCTTGVETIRPLTAEEQAASGVTPGLVRLSVGIETAADIIADLESALSAKA